MLDALETPRIADVLSLARPVAITHVSGLNDPIAVLLVLGTTKLIETPGYGAADLVLFFLRELAIGAAVGLAVGGLARALLSGSATPLRGRAGGHPRDSRAVIRRCRGIARLGIPRRVRRKPLCGGSTAPCA